MKKFLALVFILFLIPSICFAAPDIKYDKQTFDPLRGTYYLEGNVSVKNNGFIVSSDKAQVEMYSLEVHAQGHIHLTQDNISFYGNTADVYGRDKTAKVSGNLKFTQDDKTITADEGSFNWDTKKIVFTGNVHVVSSKDNFTATTITYDILNQQIEK